MKILVAVMTCNGRGYPARARAQRETWVPALRAQGVDVKFFYGGPAPYELGYGDEVYIPNVSDQYDGIPHKVKAICAYAYDHGYDYVAKVDDDVYIVPQRFPFLPLDGHDYVGRFRGPHGNYPPHFASGFCYFLTKLSCHIVRRATYNGDWMDERFVATALARADIFGLSDYVNYCVTGPHMAPEAVLAHPVLGKGTVFCEYTPQQMHEMHRVFANAQPILPQPQLHPVPVCVVTDFELLAKPCDTAPAHKLERYGSPAHTISR